MRQNRGRMSIGLNFLGLILIILALPFFIEAGGGGWLLAEVLPGQAQWRWQELKKTEAETDVAVWGIDDVKFQDKTLSSGQPLQVSAELLEKMSDISYLKNTFYTIDSRTMLLEEDIDPEEALSMDMTIDKGAPDEPKILIFHTHAHEGFADSDMSKGLDEGICGVGDELERILEEEYGISVLHHKGQYDVVNGKGQITGAYERIEPDIIKILDEYPSVEVCIDMHRDGVNEDVHLVSTVDGKECAKIMLFNGLCRLNKNGEAAPISGLANPYIKDNLAFSLQLQLSAAGRFPDLTRKIYLNPYRFILHLKPRSVLIEVGAQTNTKAEAMNAMKPLARMLADVLLEE